MVGPVQLRSKQGQFITGSTAFDLGLATEFYRRACGLRRRSCDASKAETPILLISMFGVVTAAYAAAAATKLNIPKEITKHYIPLSAENSEYFLPNLLSRNYDECLASVDNFAIVSAKKTEPPSVKYCLNPKLAPSEDLAGN